MTHVSQQTPVEQHYKRTLFGFLDHVQFQYLVTGHSQVFERYFLQRTSTLVTTVIVKKFVADLFSFISWLNKNHEINLNRVFTIDAANGYYVLVCNAVASHQKPSSPRRLVDIVSLEFKRFCHLTTCVACKPNQRNLIFKRETRNPQTFTRKFFTITV